MSTIDEVEAKLTEALKLLADAKRGLQPASVMSRIQGAQGMRGATLGGLPLSLVPTQVPKTKKLERAAFYLHYWLKDSPQKDDILRVLGDGGVAAADKIATELSARPEYMVERLNSRQYQALTETRLGMIRKGQMDVGATSARDLRGSEVQQ